MHPDESVHHPIVSQEVAGSSFQRVTVHEAIREKNGRHGTRTGRTPFNFPRRDCSPRFIVMGIIKARYDASLGRERCIIRSDDKRRLVGPRNPEDGLRDSSGHSGETRPRVSRTEGVARCVKDLCKVGLDEGRNLMKPAVAFEFILLGSVRRVKNEDAVVSRWRSDLIDTTDRELARRTK